MSQKNTPILGPGSDRTTVEIRTKLLLKPHNLANGALAKMQRDPNEVAAECWDGMQG